jgi:hypothetical protein
VTRVDVGADYDAPPDAVWRSLEPIETHIEWMADAEVIRFTTDQTRGVGTRFDCVTAIGPIRLTDRMEITEWVPGVAMGVRHVGVVTGNGRFVLAPLDGGRRTRLRWDEELRFPWWLGGPVGAAVAGRTVLRRIWSGNLERLRRRVEQAP